MSKRLIVLLGDRDTVLVRPLNGTAARAQGRPIDGKAGISNPKSLSE